MLRQALSFRRHMLRPMIRAAPPMCISMPRFFATPTPDRLASLAVIFGKWDVDQSASLDLAEIKSGLKELGIHYSDASIAKLFLDLVSRDEYDDEIGLSDKVVSLTEWLDNIPDELADEVIARSAVRLLHTAEAPRSWKPHVQKSIDERLALKDTGSRCATTLSPLINAFNDWDTDNSKTLDLLEIKAGLRQLGVAYDNAAVENLFRKLCTSDMDPLYDVAIDLDKRSVSITDWLDNCPPDLQQAIRDAMRLSRHK
jgi:Ca2+-binding EF-hand superfamily protein